MDGWMNGWMDGQTDMIDKFALGSSHYGPNAPLRNGFLCPII